MPLPCPGPTPGFTFAGPPVPLRFGPAGSWPPSALVLTFTALARDEAVAAVLAGPAMPVTFVVTVGGGVLSSAPKSAAWTPVPIVAIALAAATRMASALMDCK
jgi:hypothetical protein